MLAGVYIATKKDHSVYYRSSLTYRSKHISLGSFVSETEAHTAYLAALQLLESVISVDDALLTPSLLSFEKIVMLINFRDNNMYIPNPIYLRKNYFSYYLAADRELKFDIDDLFYYSSHKILKRQGHLYVNDYGMQITLLSRYGIKSHAVCDRDYRFVNGDKNDFRYSNIEVINRGSGSSGRNRQKISGKLYRRTLRQRLRRDLYEGKNFQKIPEISRLLAIRFKLNPHFDYNKKQRTSCTIRYRKPLFFQSK